MMYYSYQPCDNFEASQQQRHCRKADNEDDAANAEVTARATVTKLPPSS